MSLVVNNNLMAANTARNLNAHYGRLATSTQRLSSGLRVNSAADDAAGLAIRELQRADIAALQQGARNANDAISMIQVADGSLGIIDEKLIRMKELAEQAATGTYDSTQRLMIESEYQAMASEITRIANATDFNGTKLLDGTLAGDHDGSGLVSEGKMKIHFGTGNDSAEDYYYVEIGEVTSQALGLGNASTWQDVQNRAIDAFKTSLKQQIRDSGLSPQEQGALLAQIDTNADYLNQAINIATDPTQAYKYFDGKDDLEKYWPGNSDLMAEYLAKANESATDVINTAVKDALAGVDLDVSDLSTANADLAASETTAREKANKALDAVNAAIDKLGFSTEITTALKNGLPDDATTLSLTQDGDAQDDMDAWVKTNITDKITANIAALTLEQQEELKSGAMQNYWDSLRTTQQQKLQYAWGQAAIDKLASGEKTLGSFASVRDANGSPVGDFDFGKPEMITQAIKDVKTKVGHMNFAGHTIETQEDAQMALDAINEAIVSKDKIRAHLGAAQNRLENTVSNLNIQAENLQAAESRISDVDVATEMTQFVRNQILTQSAVAMLSQANSLPQMAMQLIGG